jgi:two-component system response regulator NreC
VSRPIRVLLCDDHALFRAGLTALLREQTGVDVVGESEDGQAAVEDVERLRPDIVLMDIEMPRLNGFEATRRIASTHPDVRVLILTMYVEEELVARCLEAGSRGYVLKDVPVSQLVYAIQAVASGERYLSPAAVDKVIDDGGHLITRARTSYDLLTAREREVLKLLADGLSIKEIAVRLGRSVKTVEVHKYNLMRKLDVHHRAGLVRYAIAHRLVPMPVVEDLIGAETSGQGPARAKGVPASYRARAGRV